MEIYFTPQAITVAILIWALVSTLKKILIYIGKEDLLAKGWFKGFVLTPLPLVLGAFFGYFGAIPAPNTSTRVMVGAVLGLFSSFFYNMFKHALVAKTQQIEKTINKEKEESDD